MPRLSGNKFRNWYSKKGGQSQGGNQAKWFNRAVARRRRRNWIALQSRRRNRYS